MYHLPSGSAPTSNSVVDAILLKARQGPVPLVDPITASRLQRKYGGAPTEESIIDEALNDPLYSPPAKCVVFGELLRERREAVAGWSCEDVQRAIHTLPEAYGLSLGVPLRSTAGSDWGGGSRSAVGGDGGWETSLAMKPQPSPADSLRSEGSHNSLLYKSGPTYVRADGEQFKRLVLADAFFAQRINGKGLMQLTGANINILFDAPTHSVLNAIGKVIAAVMRPNRNMGAAPPKKPSLVTMLRQFSAASTRPPTSSPSASNPLASRSFTNPDDAFEVQELGSMEEDAFDAIDSAVEKVVTHGFIKHPKSLPLAGRGEDAVSSLSVPAHLKGRPHSATILAPPSTTHKKAPQSAQSRMSDAISFRNAVTVEHNSSDIHFREMSALTRRDAQRAVDDRKAAGASARQERLQALRNEATAAGEAFGSLGAISTNPTGVVRLTHAQQRDPHAPHTDPLFIPGIMEMERRSDLLRHLYSTTKGFVKVRRSLAKLQGSAFNSMNKGSMPDEEDNTPSSRHTSPRLARRPPSSSASRPFRPNSAVSYVSIASDSDSNDKGPSPSHSHSRRRVMGPSSSLYPLTIDWVIHACVRPVLDWDETQCNAAGLYLSRRLLGAYAQLEIALANAQYNTEAQKAEEALVLMRDNPLTFDLRTYRRLSKVVSDATVKRERRLKWLAEGGIESKGAKDAGDGDAQSTKIVPPRPEIEPLPAGATLSPLHRPKSLSAAKKVQDAIDVMHAYDLAALLRVSHPRRRGSKIEKPDPSPLDPVVALANRIVAGTYKFQRHFALNRDALAFVMNEALFELLPRRFDAVVAYTSTQFGQSKVESMRRRQVIARLYNDICTAYNPPVAPLLHLQTIPNNLPRWSMMSEGGLADSGVTPPPSDSGAELYRTAVSSVGTPLPTTTLVLDSYAPPGGIHSPSRQTRNPSADSSVHDAPQNFVLKRVALAELVNHYLRLEHRSTSAAATRKAAMAATPGIVRTSTPTSTTGQHNNFYAQSENDAHFLFTLNLATRNRLLRADELRRLRLSPEEQLAPDTAPQVDLDVTSPFSRESRASTPLHTATFPPTRHTKPSSAGYRRVESSSLNGRPSSAPYAHLHTSSLSRSRRSVVEEGDLSAHLTRFDDAPRAHAAYMPDEIGFEEFERFVQVEWEGKKADDFDSCVLMLRTSIMTKRMQMAEGNADDSRRESVPLITALGNPIESAPQAFELKQMALQKSFEVMCANTVRDASASPILLLLSPQTLSDGSAPPDSNVLVEQYFWDGQNPRLKEKEPSRFANSSYPSPKQQQLHIFSIASNASLIRALTSLKEIGMPRGHWYLIDFSEAAFNRDPVEVPVQDGQAVPVSVDSEETVIQRERLRREVSGVSRASSARSRSRAGSASRRNQTAAGPSAVEIPPADAQGGLMEVFLRGLGTAIFQQRYGSVGSTFRVFVRCPRFFIGSNNLPSIAQRACHLIDLPNCVELL